LGAIGAGALFLFGIARESYWALALPLAAAVLFVLGLVFWIGWTILSVRTEAVGEPLQPAAGAPSSPTRSAPESRPPAAERPAPRPASDRS
jgi:hypothetical protein